MVDGWTGKRLRVDLSSGLVNVEDIDRSYRMKWLGGRGFNSELLYREVGPDVDPLGLSADRLPGIFVRNEFLNERIDSFVSDLLKEGYESKLGPGPVGVCEPEVLLPSFDGWLPMFNVRCSYRTANS